MKHVSLTARSGAPAPPPARAALTDWSECAAVCASTACLAHCLALPLLLAALPSLTAVLTIPESFHLWALAVAAPCAVFALGQGWLKRRVWTPSLVGSAGLALLAAGALALDGSPWEVVVTVAGALTLAGAHLLNWRLRHDCGCA